MSAVMQAFQLHRNEFGRLVFVAADGTQDEGVVPVRAFPISAPEHGVALVSADGRELVWIDDWSGIAAATKILIKEELASREFVRKSAASGASRLTPRRPSGKWIPIAAPWHLRSRPRKTSGACRTRHC